MPTDRLHDVSRTPFQAAMAAISNGAAYQLEGLTLTVNGVALALTDEEFDEAWDVMNEVDGDDFELRLSGAE